MNTTPATAGAVQSSPPSGGCHAGCYIPAVATVVASLIGFAAAMIKCVSSRNQAIRNHRPPPWWTGPAKMFVCCIDTSSEAAASPDQSYNSQMELVGNGSRV